MLRQYTVFYSNYIVLRWNQDALPLDVRTALRLEATALRRVIALMEDTIDGDAEDLEEAECRFNQLRDIHRLQGIDVLELRREKEALARQAETRRAHTRAPELSAFRLRMPTFPKLSSSTRRLRGMAMKLRGTRKTLGPDEATVLAQLQALIGTGARLDPWQIAEAYAARYGGEYYMFVFQALAEAGFD
ncbi:hypothetical protein PUNSTDRAFT_145726 [Punctularia strigosozonata HHB-11173 SS5]|uniref:uncharacterized protein n=1 Tax=Punctularia strigosozonata (strain HHB-11173) TaxID=741275 RepID=UPI0004416FB7|nr:uncharacterized protein PUNSTDRAFT_145726 [Punctularia strigosozonata HHB-11173 SS5]EIN05814.1 hypothetical protein PUNSTDRAFT_145726 [Punctularia strigosozonata HHB-11173 SS5]